jgi:hypothetical protein
MNQQENEMNPFDRKHYYFDRTDPWKHIPWANEDKLNYVKGEVFAVVCFILCIACLAGYLYM